MLRLDSISHSYGSHAALRGLTLRVEPGEIHALLGPNGAGKSTTVRIACGLIKADQGTATLDGHDLRRPAARARLGLAPQRIAMYPDLSALANLGALGRLYPIEKNDLARRINEALERVGLLEYSRRPVRTLSEGMQRRLNFAAAVLHEPTFLILDEPTAGVDPHSRQLIFERVEEFASNGVGILYTTHHMEEAQRLASRVSIIDRGSAIASGSVRELIAAHGGLSRVSVRAGTEHRVFHTDEPVRIISDALAEGGVEHLDVDEPSLEEVFFTLTGRSLRP